MVSRLTEAAEVLGELPGGLRLRRAASSDIPRLIELHARAGEREPSARDPAGEAYLRDLLERPHPAFNGRDMTVVEDTANQRLVSVQHFSQHVWAFDGVPFAVGEVEHVATDPVYRRQGLIRRQMDVMHAWADECGCLATIINGIPWFYAQFGYELAVERWAGRSLVRARVPALGPDERERYALRSAEPDDLPFIGETYQRSLARRRVSQVRTAVDWQYELSGRLAANPWRRHLLVVESADGGDQVGFVSLALRRFQVDAYELQPHVPWVSVTPSVVRALDRLLVQRATDGASLPAEISFRWLDAEHPVFRASPQLFGEQPWTAAWYVRVPDIAAFLRHVAPAVEDRLARSPVAGYSGTLGISFYRGGVRLRLEGGRLVDVEAWRPTRTYKPYVPTPPREAVGWFPDLIFLQLLFGFRSLAELEHAFVYRVGCTAEARPLLEALFRRGPSYTLPIY